MFQSALPGLTSACEPFHLRPYQQDCVDTVLSSYFYGNREKGVVEMSCGAGKTHVALNVYDELCRRDPSTTGLFLVPTIDLAVKNAREACRFFPQHEVGLVQAENREYNHPIVVATIDTLANPITRRKLFRAQRFRKFNFLWIDECHLRVQGTLEEILADLEAPYALRLGVTATPWRSDETSLLTRYPDGLFYSIGRDTLVEEGHVLPYATYRVQTTPANRMEQAVWAWSKHLEEERTVLFANNIRDAYRFRNHFRGEGIASAVVIGKTVSDRRASIYEALHGKDVKVLCNVGVLVTGVDLPWLMGAIIAKDSWMAGKYTIGHHQATGRIARLSDEIGPDGFPYKTSGKLVYLTSEKYNHIPQIISQVGALPGKGPTCFLQTPASH
jgi:superfamily II DNA or RNA helicase